MSERVDESGAPPPLSPPVGQRRRPDGRAPLQRAVDPLARSAFRAALQNRGCANDWTFRAVDFRDHELPASRRPTAPRGAVARARRPADGSSVARSRGRVFAGLEDRPPQLRSRPDRLLRTNPATNASNLRLPDAEFGHGFFHRRAGADDTDADAGAASRASRDSASPRRFNCGTGRPRSARRPEEMDAWRSFSIEEELARSCPYAVTLCNDATSACAAEFFFGEAWRHRDFLYFFLGAFVGGGLVLDGALYPGRTGNAAALGSMPIAPQDPSRQTTSQLIARASIYQLERRVEAAGTDPSSIWRNSRRLGRFRAAARRMDRGGFLRAGLCDDRGDLGPRRRSDRHRRGDARRRPPEALLARGRADRNARSARFVRREDHRRRDRRGRARNRRRGVAADQEFCA